MYSRLGTILVIVLLVFPFAALGYKLAVDESLVTALLFGGMSVLLFVTLFLGLRRRPAPPAQAEPASQQPAEGGADESKRAV